MVAAMEPLAQFVPAFVSILALVVAFALPGYLIVALFVALRDSREAPAKPSRKIREDQDAAESIFLEGGQHLSGSRDPNDNSPDWMESIFLALSLSIVAAGTIGLFLAEVGFFSLVNLTLALAFLSAALWLIGRYAQAGLRWHPSPVSRNEWIPLLLLLLLSGWLFLQPHEFITGGADAGVYVNLGANIANTGSLLIEEPLLDDLDPELWPGLLRQLPAGEQVDFIRFPGFYRSDAQTDLLIPQFFSLHPVWLAIGYALGGVWGALAMTPIWAVLGIWAVYLYARSVFACTLDARRFAWLPALLLILTPLQIYFARYPAAEPISQYLVWAGLWMFTQFVMRRGPNSLWGLAAGLVLGQVFLARIDMLPLLLLPAIWGLYLLITREWRRSEGWFWGSFVLSVLYASVHALFFSLPYTLNTYGAVLTILQRQFLFLFILLVAFVLIFGYALLFQRDRLLRFLTAAAASQNLRHGLSAILVLLALYAYFVRPVFGAGGQWNYWFTGTIVPVSDHENLVRLGWYLSPLAIWLGVLGAVLFLEREAWRFMWPLLSVGGVFTVFYLYRIFNNPIQIYAMRRYLPVTVPLIMIAVGYAFVWLWRQPRRRPAGKVVGAALILALTGWLLYNNRLIWRQVDYAGGVGQIEQLASLMQDDSDVRPIALFVDEAPVGVGAIFGTPLQYLHHMTAFDLQEDVLAMPALMAQINEWQETGHPVFVVYKEGSTPIFDTALLEPIETFVWDTPVLEQTYDHAPAMIQRSQYRLAIFRMADLGIND